ncbi:CDP-alcohol phosphatidyltransferase [Sphingobacterium spiritivorum ATCC 33300]|uniref:CDP-alcohol phosphatidyltransferase n=1 Tax=Sphingobacterium spiritivorum ATCC 33300 TaxID=525372 RepID=C2FVZ2_SPHSI|nr:CDP-alcohol phosphatidyltransferase family protein [Sphingobacterium spiritivorum]EEI92984.1 CDP-alcohol phosphatidyltransferase [Sphingobacterium spiritivorum ATCC 33300]QQS96323.1 CDP-alcohol phosphatidyltransferase family protein [Sphingobacterium spiritivorum]
MQRETSVYNNPNTPEEQETAFEQSLKSNDTEERIDIWFYRPIGFRIAQVCAKIGITPNAVTIISIFFGVGAGILFYYPSLWINVIGMLLLVFANSLDSADGQLARMTDNKSRFGRILDGFAGDFWFASIHIALCLRLMNEGWSAWVWVPGVLAGVSHVFQSAMADYYRNVHLYFIKGKAGSELDNSRDLQAEFDQMSWSKQAFSKFVLNGYLGYTRMQERLSPNLQQLLGLIKAKYVDSLPQALVTEFRTMNKPLMKYTNIVQFNTRVIFLFLWLFIGEVWLYFFFDMFVLNPILIYMINRQEKVSGYFVNKLKS